MTKIWNNVENPREIAVEIAESIKLLRRVPIDNEGNYKYMKLRENKAIIQMLMNYL